MIFRGRDKDTRQTDRQIVTLDKVVRTGSTKCEVRERETGRKTGENSEVGKNK